MKLLKKLFRNSLYVVPRLILFSIFVFSFLITAMLCLGGAEHYLHPSNLFKLQVSKP